MKIGPSAKYLRASSASACSAGVKSMRSSSVKPWRSNAGGLVGNGCVGDVTLARHVGLADRPLLDRPDRLAVRAIEDEDERLLRDLGDGLDRLAVDGDVDQDRRGREVVVPDVVMDQLVVPDDARPSSRRGRRDCRRRGCCPGDLRRTSRRSAPRPAGRRSRAPRRRTSAPRHRRCRVYFGGALEPRVVAGLALARDRVEGPQQLAGAHVEAAHVALQVLLGRRHACRRRARGRRSRRRRSRARASCCRCWFSVSTSPRTPTMRSTTPFSPKPGHLPARGGIERDEIEAWRHDEQPFVARCRSNTRDRGPTSCAARPCSALRRRSVERPRASRPLRIDRDHIPRDADGRVQHAADHQRRRLVARAQASGHSCPSGSATRSEACRRCRG